MKEDNPETPLKSHSDGDEAAARALCNPLTWPELLSIISAGDLHKLARSEEQEQTYRKARSKVRCYALLFACCCC